MASELDMSSETEAAGISGTGLTADIFSKRLPDDCVEYTILVIDSCLKSISDQRRSLKEIQDAARDLVKKHLGDFIWQRDSFVLSISPATKAAPTGLTPLAWTLRGSTNFGDSIGDEWLIVWLLRTLSAQFPSAWIRLEDIDGEFLLVEAANKLPKWLNPEIADNRVWINEGKLKIIPLSSDGGDEAQSSNLALEQAVHYLSHSAAQLLHDQAIEDEAFFRLRDYPSAIQRSLHRTMVKIPRRLAYILHQQPAHTSPAVEAFYLRDPISVKPLATKDTATLFFPPEDFVTVSTRFTRVGYAQLHGQEFPPPPSWTCVTPHIDDEKVTTGMKLACGFEMLLHDPSNADKRCVREVQLLLSDLDSGDDELPSDAEIATWDQTQDDEKWLDINYEDLDRELRGTANGAEPQPEGASFGDAAAQANLRKLVERFETFMADEKAGPDGVEDSDDASTSASNSEEEEEEEEDKEEDADGATRTTPDVDAAFTTSMREVHNLSATDSEHQQLTTEARRLALEMEDDAEGQRDDDAEAQQVMRMAEALLAARRQAVASDDKGKGKAPALPLAELSARAQSATQRRFVAGKTPAPFPSRTSAVVRGGALDDDDDEELLEGEYELSSDDDDGENDVDLELLKNVLASFGGQQGMGGPAGNVLGRFGVKMPRPEK